MPRLYIEHISKTFKSGKIITKALDDVTLEVKDGEFIGLLGRPGAGKTTLLRTLCGLENPDSGRVYLGDQDVTEMDPADRDISFVFQTYALYPQLTVFDNIAFPLRKRKWTKEQIGNKVREVAELIQITHILEKKPAQCSGGERQRIATARGIAREPKILLLDEPLSNLDAKLRLHMRAELKSLVRKLKTTAIFSTPDEVEAMTIPQKICVLDSGGVQQYDTVENVYDHPSNLFVGTFVGSPSMNVFEGDISVDGKALFKAESFTADLTHLKNRVQGKSGKVLLGIRPLEMTVSKKQGNAEGFKVEVEVVEHLGPETILDLKVGGSTIKVVVPPSFEANRGDSLWVSFNKEKIHLFDSATKQAIA